MGRPTAGNYRSYSLRYSLRRLHGVRAGHGGCAGGGGGSGTFYAIEMQNPIFNHGNCSAVHMVYERVNRSITALASWVAACSNGMVMRMMIRPGMMSVWESSSAISSYAYWDSDITTGEVGIGARGTPAGNSITQVQLGLSSDPSSGKGKAMKASSDQ